MGLLELWLLFGEQRDLLADLQFEVELNHLVPVLESSKHFLERLELVGNKCLSLQLWQLRESKAAFRDQIDDVQMAFGHHVSAACRPNLLLDRLQALNHFLDELD